MYIYNKSSHSRQIGEKSFLLFSPPPRDKTLHIYIYIYIYIYIRTHTSFLCLWL